MCQHCLSVRKVAEDEVQLVFECASQYIFWEYIRVLGL